MLAQGFKKPISVEVVTTSLKNIALHDEQLAKIKFENKTSNPFAINGFLEIKDGENKTLLKRIELNKTISNKNPLILNDPMNGTKGVFNINYTLVVSGDDTIKGRIAYCNMYRNQIPTTKKGVKLGLQGMHRADNFEESLQTAIALGIQISRMNMSWRAIEKVKGKYNYGFRDYVVDRYLAAGIQPQFLLSSTPFWAVKKEKQVLGEDHPNWRLWGTYSPENPEDWSKFISNTAKRYAGRVFLYEIWNEADWGFYTGSTDDYLKMLEIAYNEIKAVNSQNMVLSSGFAVADPFAGVPNFKNDLQARVLDEGRNWFDYHTMHQHGEFEKLVSTMESILLPYRKKTGVNKPLYFNETAESSNRGNYYQAEIAVKKALYCFSIGSEYYDLFSYQDPPGEGNPYGIVEEKTYFPKPIMPAYSMLIRAVHAKKFIRKVDIGKNRWAFEFADVNESVIVYWNENKLDSRSVMLIGADASNAELYDMYGNKTNIKAVNHTYALSCESLPNYLVVKHANGNFRFLNDLLVQNNTLSVFDGKASIDLILNNKTGHRIDLEFEIMNELSQQKVRLNSNQQEKISFDLMPKTESVLLTWKSKTYQHGGSLEIPVSHNIVPLPELETKLPTFVVDKKKHVVNFAEADPTRWHQNWKGPNDLSYQLWCYTSNDKLIVKYKIMDDVKVFNKYSKAKHRGESIQLFLKVPEQVGMWNIIVGSSDKNSQFVDITQSPQGFKPDLVKGISYTEQILNDNSYIAQIEMPLQSIGLNRENLKKGFYFNTLINDDDNEAEGRSGYMRLEEGIGGKINVDLFKYFIYNN